MHVKRKTNNSHRISKKIFVAETTIGWLLRYIRPKLGFRAPSHTLDTNQQSRQPSSHLSFKSIVAQLHHIWPMLDSSNNNFIYAGLLIFTC